MNDKPLSFSEQLAEHFDDQPVEINQGRDMITLEVGAGAWLRTAKALRDDFGFAQLTDLCGVDYLTYGLTEWETEEAATEGYSRGVEELGPGRFSWSERPEAEKQENRFAVVVHLLNLEQNRRLRLRYFAPDESLPVVPSLTDIWNVANWYEREAFDLFGIIFEGHPDLRRLLTDYGFVGHPFRKDFPLIGNVTVRYDADKQRVIYEPVEIEPRVLVPRVVREDSRYTTDAVDTAAEARAESLAEDRAKQAD